MQPKRWRSMAVDYRVYFMEKEKEQNKKMWYRRMFQKIEAVKVNYFFETSVNEKTLF